MEVIINVHKLLVPKPEDNKKISVLLLLTSYFDGLRKHTKKHSQTRVLRVLIMLGLLN